MDSCPQPLLPFFRKNYNLKDFVPFVNYALLFHDSSSRIDKLLIQFCFHDDLPKEFHLHSLINAWLFYAIRGEVKELTLDLSDGDMTLPFDEWPSSAYPLPQFLYSYDSLIELNIRVCDIMARGKINWLKLKTISIGYSILTEDIVETILSGCPVLESLELYSFLGIHCLNITSLSLKRLVVNGIWATDEIAGIERFLEISAPYVEDLKISGCWLEDELRVIAVLSLISCFLDVQILIDGDYVATGKHGNIVKRLVEMVKHAKELKIGKWCLEQSSCRYDYGDNNRELQSQKSDFSGLLSHLKIIEIFSLDATYDTFEEVLPLIEFLIKNANVLEKVIIYDAASFATQNLLKMAEILLSFPRCSPRAVILFKKLFHQTGFVKPPVRKSAKRTDCCRNMRIGVVIAEGSNRLLFSNQKN